MGTGMQEGLKWDEFNYTGLIEQVDLLLVQGLPDFPANDIEVMAGEKRKVLGEGSR